MFNQVHTERIMRAVQRAQYDNQREEIKNKSVEDHRRDFSLRIDDMVDELHRLHNMAPKFESPAYAGMGIEYNAIGRLEQIAKTATVLIEAIKVRSCE